MCYAVTHRCDFLHRYAITVWYFDADERARAKEKYLTGEVRSTNRTVLFLRVFNAPLHHLVCLFPQVQEKKG